MGAWGCGSFENDDAAAWVHEFKNGGVTAVASALERVCGIADGEYLEAPEASAAIAAAEIVAAARDGDPSTLSQTAREAFARHRDPLIASHLSESARRAVERIRRRSELKDLWEEGDQSAKGNDWCGEVDRLLRRLR